MTIKVNKEVPLWQLVAGFGSVLVSIIGLGWYLGSYQATNTATLAQLAESVSKLDAQFANYSERQVSLERQVAIIRVQVDNHQRALDKLEKQREPAKGAH